MMASLGRNLARMGYCVIIPDIVAFGDEPSAANTSTRSRSSSGYSPSRIKESVQELRSVMRWAYENGE